jgi:ribosomal protein L17
MTTEKTTIPDLRDASIIARRYIEAAILKNVFDEIADKFEENCGGTYWKSML